MITLPPDHYVRAWQPPAWSLTTERVSQQIIHVLGFAVIRSIIILVHANIYSLSLAVRLKRDGCLTTSKRRLECKNTHCLPYKHRTAKKALLVLYNGFSFFMLAFFCCAQQNNIAKWLNLPIDGVHQNIRINFSFSLVAKELQRSVNAEFEPRVSGRHWQPRFHSSARLSIVND